MNIPFGTPMIGPEERNAVAEVMAGPILVHGPKAVEFENAFAAYTKAPYAISVSSCTAGMHLIYFTLGLGPGDEVVVPAQTHVATAHAVELTGAKAVFVDADSGVGNIDLDKIEEAITPRTKAIAVVHYLGVPVNMQRVKQVAEKYGLFLVEDCALSPGAFFNGIHTGLHGDAGVFSFYPVKHITTAEGGMIVLKDAELAARLRLNKAFGVDRTHTERKVPGVYDTVTLGFNYRMSEIHAAIGIEQIKKLPDFLLQRRNNFEKLSSLIGSIKDIRVLPAPISENIVSCHYCLSVVLDEKIAGRRPEIMNKLTSNGVGSSVYYPQPVPRMTYYRERYGYAEDKYINAAILSDRSIALPVGPHLNEEHMIFIANTFIEILNSL